jgi:hypothetical protein
LSVPSAFSPLSAGTHRASIPPLLLASFLCVGGYFNCRAGATFRHYLSFTISVSALRFLYGLFLLLCHPLACLCLSPISVYRSISSVDFLCFRVNSSVTMLVLHFAICLICQPFCLLEYIFLRLLFSVRWDAIRLEIIRSFCPFLDAGRVTSSQLSAFRCSRDQLMVKLSRRPLRRQSKSSNFCVWLGW